MFASTTTSLTHEARPLESHRRSEFTVGELQRAPGRFAEAYERYHDRVAGYVYRRVRCRHACEDIVSDVFLSAYRGLSRARRLQAPVRLWLLRIATNRVHRWLERFRSLQPLPDDGASADDAGTDGERELVREEVHTALLALPSGRQAVLALHYLEGLSVSDVAKVLGCREGTVKSRLSRARASLLTELVRRRSK